MICEQCRPAIKQNQANKKSTTDGVTGRYEEICSMIDQNAIERPSCPTI